MLGRAGKGPGEPVLVVEDERRLAGSLRGGLEVEGFAIDMALDRVEGL